MKLSTKSKLVAGFFSATIVASNRARAEATPQDVALAEEAFKAAVALFDANKYEEACTKFAESHRLDPAIGVELRLAHCYEKIGRIGSASTHYANVIDNATKVGDQRRKALAQKRLDAIGPRVPKITVNVSASLTGLDGLVVELDGVRIESAHWGKQTVIDPGKHTITANAPGRKPFMQEIDIRESANEARTITTLEVISVPEPEPDKHPKVEPPPRQVNQTGGWPQIAPPSPPDKAGFGRKIAGGVIGVAGVGGIALGGVFGARAWSKRDEMREACITGNELDCKDVEKARPLYDQTMTAATVSTVSFTLGGVALTGAALLLFWPTNQSEKRSATVFWMPWVNANTIGASAQGVF